MIKVFTSPKVTSSWFVTFVVFGLVGLVEITILKLLSALLFWLELVANLQQEYWLFLQIEFEKE